MRPYVSRTRQLCALATTLIAAPAGAQGTFGLVADIEPGPPGSAPGEFAVLDGALYFTASQDGHENLYRYAEGTVSVAATYDEYIDELTPLDGRLYFASYWSGAGGALLVFDPTTGTISLAADVDPGSGSSDPELLTAMNGRLYFLAEDAAGDDAVFEYDPASDTVEPIPASGSSMEALIPLDGRLYFSAEFGKGPDFDTKLFVYDPAAGTTSIAADDTNAEEAVALDGKLYFRESSPETGRELFVYDPSTGVVTLAADVAPGVEASIPDLLTALDGHLYFEARTPETGWELFVYDPATGVAALAADLTPEGESAQLRYLTPSGGRLYFTRIASAPSLQTELYVYDPASGTASLIADVTGPEDFESMELAGFDGRLFLSAFAPATGYELYAYDPGGNTPTDGGPAASGLKLHPPAPHPVSDVTAVRFTLDRAGPLRLTLSDILGRDIALLATGIYTPGDHELLVDAAGFGLRPGPYVLHLEAGGHRLSQPFTVVR